MEQKRTPALKDLMNCLRVRGSVFLLVVVFFILSGVNVQPLPEPRAFLEGNNSEDVML